VFSEVHTSICWMRRRRLSSAGMTEVWRMLRAFGSGHKKRFAHPGIEWYNPCVTSNTITIRLRRPRAEVEAKAKPNLNAWVNQLIEQAIGPRNADWNEHFDRPSSGRKFHYSSQVKRAER